MAEGNEPKPVQAVEIMPNGLTSADDLNDYRYVYGHYLITSKPINSPTGWARMVVLSTVQIIFTDSKVWIRQYLSSTGWGHWYLYSGTDTGS